MTGTALQLTAEADARLDDYLRQVRLALAGLLDVSPDDVEADIREHVAAELRGVSNPVTVAELDAVLRALGPPAAWRPAGAPRGPAFDWRGVLAAARRVVADAAGVLYRGPEDWRLAYLCLVLVMLAPVTLGASLIAAYLLGRAAAELARERGESLGARRWLVYPPVVLVSLPLLLAVTLWPVGVAPLTLNVFVWPAETYRAAVLSVDADGTVQLRPGYDTSRGYRLAEAGITGSQTDRAGRRVWRVSEPSRTVNERTLAVLDRVPVPGTLAGPALAAFATVGVALVWWFVIGVFRRAFPRLTAAVFLPLLSPTPRGLPWGVVGCAVLFAAWLGLARSLAG